MSQVWQLRMNRTGGVARVLKGGVARGSERGCGQGF